jgi:hypothetical protein
MPAVNSTPSSSINWTNAFNPNNIANAIPGKAMSSGPNLLHELTGATNANVGRGTKIWTSGFTFISQINAGANIDYAALYTFTTGVAGAGSYKFFIFVGSSGWKVLGATAIGWTVSYFVGDWLKDTELYRFMTRERLILTGQMTRQGCFINDTPTNPWTQYGMG